MGKLVYIIIKNDVIIEVHACPFQAKSNLDKMISNLPNPIETTDSFILKQYIVIGE